MTVAEIHGVCDERFEAVRRALARNLDSGGELGASIVLDLDGDVVIDLWGGFGDQARTVPWDEHTIVTVFSSTKTDQPGRADAGRPGPAGRRGAGSEVLAAVRGQRQTGRAGPPHAVACHRGFRARPAGRHGGSFDWERSTSRMAAQAPWREPGTASGYHACNYGHLVGEVVRRISGKPLKQFVAEEIAGPLGADFQIGAAESDWGRIADVIPPPPLDIDLAALDMDSPAVKTFTGPVPVAEYANTPGWRGADIGAGNGHGNARSAARSCRRSPAAARSTASGCSARTPST
jgi:CubicO group peptidase (beta-lactamase class C family)